MRAEGPPAEGGPALGSGWWQRPVSGASPMWGIDRYHLPAVYLPFTYCLPTFGKAADNGLDPKISMSAIIS